MGNPNLNKTKMARRKTAKQNTKKSAYKLPTEFNCPFCNFKKCVECKLYHTLKKGSISCRVCGHTYETTINHLTEPADLYCSWIDECERINEEETSKITSTKKSTHKTSRAKSLGSRSEITI